MDFSFWLDVLFWLCLVAIVLKLFEPLIVSITARVDTSQRRKLANATIQKLSGLSDFHADFAWVTIADQRGLAIDESRGLLMLIGDSQRKVVRFAQIVSCEIREDNASLITTRRGV